MAKFLEMHILARDRRNCIHVGYLLQCYIKLQANISKVTELCIYTEPPSKKIIVEILKFAW